MGRTSKHRWQWSAPSRGSSKMRSTSKRGTFWLSTFKKVSASKSHGLQWLQCWSMDLLRLGAI